MSVRLGREVIPCSSVNLILVKVVKSKSNPCGLMTYSRWLRENNILFYLKEGAFVSRGDKVVCAIGEVSKVFLGGYKLK